MLRVIREISPRWVVGENVLGLVNWSGGLVFDQVQSDLEAEGYEVQSYVLPACAVNAPHRRDWVWIVAHRDKWSGQEHELRSGGDVPEERDNQRWPATDPEGLRVNRTSKHEDGNRQGRERGGCDADDIGKIQNGEFITDPGLQRPQVGQQQAMGTEQLRQERDATNAGSKQLQRGLYPDGPEKTERHVSSRHARENRIPDWDNFPTERPIRLRNDGVSKKLLIFVVKELYERISETSKENRIENLHEVWKRISTPEVWEQVRGFYSLESKEVLFQAMQLYSTENIRQGKLSPFSEEISKPVLLKLRKYGEFRHSPQGQKLEKQRSEKLGNIMSYLPHEIPLAARAFETAIAKFEAWHRNESIKAYGNAIVPQVVYQIFKSINEYEQNKNNDNV